MSKGIDYDFEAKRNIKGIRETVTLSIFVNHPKLLTKEKCRDELHKNLKLVDIEVE